MEKICVSCGIILKSGMEIIMKTVAKKLSCIGGALAASALIASMMIAPAFAADPTYRSSTGQYTETVAYDSSVETASTEVLIDTKFHYLDYSPEIDVTYSWDEDLEWTYVKNGKYGFWTKGNDEASSWSFTQLIYGSRNMNVSEATGYTDSKMSEQIWSAIAQYLEPTTANGYGEKAVVIKLANNAADELYASFEEQGFAYPEATINGKTYSSAEYSEKGYLDYLAFYPADTNSTTTRYSQSYASTLSSSVVVGTNTSEIPYANGLKGNEYYVGVLPRADFTPRDAWAADARKDPTTTINAKLKIIFTKKEA